MTVPFDDEPEGFDRIGGVESWDVGDVRLRAWVTASSVPHFPGEVPPEAMAPPSAEPETEPAEVLVRAFAPDGRLLIERRFPFERPVAGAGPGIAMEVNAAAASVASDAAALI